MLNCFMMVHTKQETKTNPSPIRRRDQSVNIGKDQMGDPFNRYYFIHAFSVCTIRA